MKKIQKARAEALEAAMIAAAKAGQSSGCANVTLSTKEVLKYAEFILGKPAKKKRRRAGRELGRAYVSLRGTLLPESLEDLEDPAVDELDHGKAAGCPECAEEDADGELSPAVPATEPDPVLLKESLGEEPSAPVGEAPGDWEVLTQWAEAIRAWNAEQEAALEARDLECDPEAARRKDRDLRLKEGRTKLASRRLAENAGSRGVLLDEDELLAVAGSEVYPPNDEEPSRELKIRNRKGAVMNYVATGRHGGGWTTRQEEEWGLRHAWMSLEMSLRGPWHVV